MNSTISLFFLFVVLSVAVGCRVQNYPPELTRLSASTDFVDADLTLSGYQFGDEPIVTFGSLTAPIKSHSDNSILVTVPFAAPGTTQVRVRNSQGITDPLPFMVKQPIPIVAKVTPANGVAGSTVVISGNYLNQLQKIQFNGIDAAVQDSTAQKLTVVVPANVPRGPIPISITTIAGTLSIPFIVAGTPQITSVSPLQTKPGAQIVIQGKNLLDGVVSINGLATDKTQTTIQDTEIRTIVPVNATSGLVSVTVFESLTAVSTDTLKVFQAPAITHLQAQDGVAGEKLVVEGLNLQYVTGVTVGSVNATFRVVSNTQLEVVLPVLTASGHVTITATSVGGTASSQEAFFYFLPPSAITFTPARQQRGLSVTISGKDLYRISDVKVNGVSSQILSRVEGSNVVVNVPTTATSGPIAVTSRAGSATSTASLGVVLTPTVTDFLPVKGRPSDKVVIRGTSLQDAQIYFGGSFTPSGDGGKNTDTERWVLVPSDAQTGAIRVVNTAGEVTTTTSFTVIKLVTIADFTPKTAKVGDTVVISGQGLSTVTSVRFNGGTSSPATFQVSGSSLIVTVPAGATTDQICLTNDAGTVCTSANITITK